MFYGIVCTLIAIFSRLFLRVRIIGLENIPKEGGVIVAANHLSFLDIPLLGSSIYRMGRPADFMGKKELYTIPIIGFLLRMLRGFPVDRERVDRAALREAVKRLQSGTIVVIYPEGRRSRDGRLQPGKPGVGVIVRMSGKKVIPVAIQGTDKAMPAGKWVIRSAPITIQFGHPLDFSNRVNGGSERESAEQITKSIMDHIATLIESSTPP